MPGIRRAAAWASRMACDRRAKVWNPKDIQDPTIEQKVLAQDRVGPEPLTEILRSLKLQSIDRVDNLQALREIVLALEAVAQERAVKQ